MTDRNRWALLVGIDRYQCPEVPQLGGCGNDVDLMADTLARCFAFPRGHITILRDGQATRDAILAAMDTLAGRARDGDIVVVHYSGHGSQMTDREGDEPDGLDETIVPVDSGRGTHPNRDITDDEIHAWLLRLSEVTPHVTLIFDCCHSGTISRDPFGSEVRWLAPDLRPAAELPPSPLPARVTRDVGPSGWLPLSQRYVLIAGCRDDESSYEHQVREGWRRVSHGALTYFLCRELAQSRPGITYHDVFARTALQVTAAYPRQHPQMEGARDRLLFGVDDVQPLSSVPVRQRARDVVTLGAGAAHGVTAGSQWAIYPEGSKRLAGQAGRLGLVQIARVGALTAEATILQEHAAGAIAPGGQAVEEAHAYGEMRLAVELQAPAGYEAAAAELAGCIEACALLRRVEQEPAADARAYLVAPRLGAGQGDPLPQLGAVARATWAVAGRDGRLLMPTHPADEAGVAALLCDNLARLARYRQTLALRNLDPANPLDGKVVFTLLRQGANGRWVPAEPDDAGGHVAFRAGECVAFAIANHHTAPIYASILDFGLAGAVSLLHPVAGASEPLAPGRVLEVGAREGEEIELYLPDSVPYLPDPGDQAEGAGTETFKLVATTAPADLSLLTQGGVRDLLKVPAGAELPVHQLLDLALTGHGTRDARPVRVAAGEEWTTVERPICLRR